MEIDLSDDDEEHLEDETIEDIDAGDVGDAQFCTEYVQEIFTFLRQKEATDSVSPTYMEKQLDIQERHRTLLIDWLVEVAVRFNFLSETVFLCVAIIDRFLQKKTVSKQRLQLLGVTALLIASKYEEIQTPSIDTFVSLTNNFISREEMIQMERMILITLDFNLALPTPLHFLRRFSKAALSDSRIHTLSKYLIELSMLDYKMLKYLPSVIAGAAVYIARKMTGISPLWVLSLFFFFFLQPPQELTSCKFLFRTKRSRTLRCTKNRISSPVRRT
jgi:cyclin B